MEELVSIIVPCYNVAPWINRCVDSILAQTYTKLEVILIDDGSTDETGKIIDQYAEKDKRVIPVHKKNEGLVAGRETGIKLSTGDYVGFVDGDDEIVPDFYERLLKNAIQYHADISHCGLEYCFYNGLIIDHWNTGKLKVLDHKEGLMSLLEGKEIEPSLCNKLYKRELLINSCLDPGVINNEDLLRNYVLFDRANVSVFEDFCGYHYWRRDESMSNHNDYDKIADNVLKAKRIILHQSSEEIKPYAAECYLNGLVAIIDMFAGSKNTLKYNQYRKELIEHKDLIPDLPARTQRIAKLIVYTPGLHKFAFRMNQVRKKWLKIYR